MGDLANWIQDFTGLTHGYQDRIVTSILILVLLWLVRALALRIDWRRTENAQTRYRWQKGTIYFAVAVGAILVGRLWYFGFRSMATILGLVTAGVAIALQDLVKSLAGWVFLMWRKPFSVGDRIQVGEHRGDVIDARIFKFTLMEIGNWVDADQSTGRVIHLPNSLILTEVIANYTKGLAFIWNEIPVLITFESNWKKAKQILSGIADRYCSGLTTAAQQRIREASKQYMIFYKSLTPIVYTSKRDSGVLLTLRYLVDPRKRRSSEEAVWENILAEFAQCPDIEFAYPTQRFYRHPPDGNPG